MAGQKGKKRLDSWQQTLLLHPIKKHLYLDSYYVRKRNVYSLHSYMSGFLLHAVKAFLTHSVISHLCTSFPHLHKENKTGGGNDLNWNPQAFPKASWMQGSGWGVPREQQSLEPRVGTLVGARRWPWKPSSTTHLDTWFGLSVYQFSCL